MDTSTTELCQGSLPQRRRVRYFCPVFLFDYHFVLAPSNILIQTPTRSQTELQLTLQDRNHLQSTPPGPKVNFSFLCTARPDFRLHNNLSQQSSLLSSTGANCKALQASTGAADNILLGMSCFLHKGAASQRPRCRVQLLHSGRQWTLQRTLQWTLQNCGFCTVDVKYMRKDMGLPSLIYLTSTVQKPQFFNVHCNVHCNVH